MMTSSIFVIGLFLNMFSITLEIVNKEVRLQ